MKSPRAWRGTKLSLVKPSTPSTSVDASVLLRSRTFIALWRRLFANFFDSPTNSSIAAALMTKLPGGSQKSFKTQEGAIAAFNKALMVPGAVRVAYQ